MSNRKVVLVGTGMVGMSFAYSLMQQDANIEELVLIDINQEKAEGEAMDLSHGLPYINEKIDIYAGNYQDCANADVIVVTAGAAQKPGQTRLELTAINTKILKSIGEQIKASGFNGVIICASNPCDIMTYVLQKATGLPTSQVFGSGTMLDTARLRYIIADYLEFNPSNVHAYILGEHGDSSFVPWTYAYIGSKPLIKYLEETHKDLDNLLDIYESARDAAYVIIKKKKATYYGIGIALARLVKSVLNNDDSIIPVSAYQNGEYQQKGLYIGVPACVTRKGIQEIIHLELNEFDQMKFNNSCNNLRKIIDEIVDPILETKA